MEKKGRLVCVVPVYNEGDLIVDTIEALKNISLIDKIVIVNDGSIDNTIDVIKSLDISIINIDKNRGKGYAMKKAMETLEYSYIAFVDGDLGDSSMEIEKLIIPVINDEADVSVAKFQMPADKGGFGMVKALARKGVYFFTKVEVDYSLSGQRVYKKKVVDRINYIPDRYGIEVAMTIQTIDRGFSVMEVPVNMHHRYSGRNLKGFIHRGRQFLDISKTLIAMYFRR